jgi:membrane-bound ClpP family serine protease
MRPVLLTALMSVVVTLFAGTIGRADEPPPDDGLFITVATPITDAVQQRVIETIKRAKADRKVRKIVLDFNPDNRDAATREPGACYNLTEFLLSQRDLKTVAFVHKKVSRHTVLPVLACSELVMARDGKIGEVLPDAEPGQPTEAQLLLYGRAAGKNRSGLILKMLDPRVEVVRAVDRVGGVWYIDRRQEAELANDGLTLDAQPLLPAGTLALLTAEQALKFGLCKVIKDSRQELAEAYQMSPNSLREDPLQGRSPRAWLIEVRGPLERGLAESLRRRIRAAIAQNANVLIFRLDSRGGDPGVARELADHIRTLKDDIEQLPVLSIAFVPTDAPDLATFLAFGCSEIVLAPKSKLGFFEDYLRKSPQERNGLQEALSDLAKEQGYSPLIARGMFDTELVLYRARSVKGNEYRIITEDEYKADQAGEKKWNANPILIKTSGQLLHLDGGRGEGKNARDLGVARFVVEDAADIKELCSHYGLEPARVRHSGPDWLDNFAAFLRWPAVAVMLIMLGVGCLIIELKVPGLGLPGVTSALCFVLFFWSQSQLSGQYTVLAILLFVLGLVMIGIEIFLIPGFGIVGFSGVVLVLAGLGLATVERIPQSSQEWVGFGNTVTTFGLSMIAASVGAMVFARYLPHIPYANRLMLVPPTDKTEGADDEPALPGVAEAAALLGAIGVAATPLRPAGMAHLGDQFVDVMTEGDFVNAGDRIQVIEVEGNSIKVKRI